MVCRSSLRLFGIAGGSLLLGIIAACAAPTAADDSSGASAATKVAFDRNNVLDDKSMRDSTAMTAGDVQKFLEKTPWGTTSGLATYTENGKSAAQIMVEAATANRINPLEMLVRVQMEQGLISKTTAPDKTVAIAFGCGCPDSAACSDKYMGFSNQATCAAGTMSRSMDKAVTETGTVSGWARSKSKTTQDSVTIVPANAVTAALYTYTPYVGEAGGGKAGVGGVSLHAEVWNSFASFTNYGPWSTTDAKASTDAGTGTDSSTADASVPDPADDADVPHDPVDSGTDPGTDPSAPPPVPDAGADASSGSAGTPETNGSDDGNILGGGNAPPSSNSAPAAKTPTKPTSYTEATDAELAGKPKSTGGCSTTGSTPTSNVLLAFGVAMALVAARRRSKK